MQKIISLILNKFLKFKQNKPISFEVFADEKDSMIEQGRKINSWGKNVYVKVPVVKIQK